jgi:hypothetical protein
VTLRSSGEHVKIEAWSSIAAAYRVRSRKGGLQLVTDDEVDEVPVHPEVHLGKHWSRCQAPACGAPLTPDLPICPQCHAPTCTCGRCRCERPAAKAARAKAVRKKTAATAR